MTQDRIPRKIDSSWRHIWHLSWPIMISNLSQPLVTAADTAMMGHFDDASYIGGVALGSLIIHFLVMLFSFLRMGTTALTSQAHGAGNQRAVLLPLQRGLVIGAGAGMVLIATLPLLIATASIILPASQAVEHHMANYISVQIFGLPAILMNAALLGWLYGQQSMRLGMIQLLLVNGLNIGLNFLFVLGFDGGIKGVALASVVANWLGFLFVVMMIKRQFSTRLAGFFALGSALRGSGWSAYFSLSRDIVIRTFLLYLVEATLLYFGGDKGDVQLASLQIILVIFHLVAFALDGFAHASEALVGGAIGSGSKDTLTQTIWRSTAMAGFVSVLIAMLLIVSAPYLLAILTSYDDVIGQTMALWWYVVCLGPASVLAFQMDGIFIGAAHGRALRNGMILSFTSFVGCLLLLRDWGLDGVMLAFIIYLMVRGLSLAIRLRHLYDFPAKA